MKRFLILLLALSLVGCEVTNLPPQLQTQIAQATASARAATPTSTSTQIPPTSTSTWTIEPPSETPTPTSSIIEVTPCGQPICEVGTPVNFPTPTQIIPNTPTVTATSSPTSTRPPTSTATTPPTPLPTPRPTATQGPPTPTFVPTVNPPLPTPTSNPNLRQPLGIPGTWWLVFVDEFDGSSLDLKKWSPTWFHGNSGVSPRVNGAETGDYDSANVTVAGGLLTISAQARKCLNLPNCTGIISSNGKFQYTYGAVEWRVWIDGSGCTAYNWASVWQDGQVWSRDGEVDVMEILGGHASWHFHYPGGGPGGTPSGCYVGWHTFAADWEPTVITWYYDGLKVGTLADKPGEKIITGAPMYLIANYAMPNTVHLPSKMQIDYTAVWQKVTP